MKIQISNIDRDKGYIYSEYSYRIDKKSRLALFRMFSREFGRCMSKVYVGQGTPVGWCFEKKSRYENTNKPFVMETWVTITEYRHVDLDELEAA